MYDKLFITYLYLHFIFFHNTQKLYFISNSAITQLKEHIRVPKCVVMLLKNGLKMFYNTTDKNIPFHINSMLPDKWSIISTIISIVINDQFSK